MTMEDGRRAALARLTENEKQCLRRRLIPQTAKEMAIDLGISPHAVEKRLKMARTKLGLSSSLQAARILAQAEGTEPELGPQTSDLSDTAPSEQRTHTPQRLWTAAWIGGTVMIFIAAIASFVLMQDGLDPPIAQTSEPGARVTASNRVRAPTRTGTPEEIRAFILSSFATMDRDGSGYIERAEAPGLGVSRPYPKGNPPPPEEVSWLRDKVGQAAWIARIDMDDDGRVSRGEFLGFSQPIFARRGIPADWKPRRPVG